MPWLYCKTCGKVIGEFYSILEVVDEFVKPIKKRHEKYCEGRPKNLKEDESPPIIDELSIELRKFK